MALQPPRIQTEDPGAHEISESSDDHFSSASEGSPKINPNRLSTPMSPVPVTRVERVDDQPAHGEVPGTAAYSQRTQDAVPDEVEIVPEGQRSRSGTTRGRSASNLSAASGNSRPGTPGGSPIPRTVVERVDDKPAHGEVKGTEAWAMRKEDAQPDEVKRVSESEGREQSDASERPVSDEERQAWFRNMWEGKGEEHAQPAESQEETGEQGTNEDEAEEDDDFGDDFDDFAEGQQDDDFGDFDEADETPMAPEPQLTTQQSAQQPDLLAGLPPLDLSDPPSMAPYFAAIFPKPTDAPPTPPITPPSEVPGTPFLSDRSLSLWQQLLQPPPMAPPNWTRSRIRRLFLVSLGVPVDLDEILPPSKQKRLVLPNINLQPSSRDPSPRLSTSVDRLKNASSNNPSTTSLDSKGAPKPRKTRTKGPPPPPEFDLNAAALLCSVTDEALGNMEDAELYSHVANLQERNGTASKVLEYWLMRRDEGLKEKEALEGVIENLVGFVKGRRGGK